MRKNIVFVENCNDMKTVWFLATVLILTLFLPGPSPAAGDKEARKADTLTLYLENDLFGYDNRDRYYTHGTKLSWVSRDLSNYRESPLVPKWMHPYIEQMPFVNDPKGERIAARSRLDKNQQRRYFGERRQTFCL